MTADSRRDLWLGLALLALLLPTYFSALSGGFIWDDDAHLTANPCIVGPLGLKEIWTTAHMRICPLVQTTFWMEFRLWGLNPLPYHLVNLLMHAGAALVLWRVLRILQVPGAWLGAALWALHPVQVESVAWITEMKNTQSGVFFLLAVLSFAKSRQAASEHPAKNRSGVYYVLTLVFAALAMASKSSTVVLPLILGLCAWWMDKRWHWRRNLIQLSPLLLLSVVTGLITIWTQKAEGAFEPEFTRDFAERLAGVGKVVWFYAGKLVWPHPLIFIYPRWRVDPSIFTAYLPTLATVAVMIVLWCHRDRWARSAFFTAAIFIAALLPVLGLVDTFFWRYSYVGDHFQYLASMGPLALIGAGLATSLKTLRDPSRWLMKGVGALLLLTLGLLSARQCAKYQNDEVLWTITLQLNPASWIAHNNLAAELASQPSRLAEAVAHYEETLRLRPNHAKAHYSFAQTLAKIPGRQNDAIEHFESALRIDPSLGLAHLNLAVLLAARSDRDAEAIAHYEQALRVMPESAAAHYDLAIQLRKLPGREQEVIAHYREAVRLRPDFVEAHYNLALALANQSGSSAEAAAHFESALRLRPNWPEAHHNYAMLLSNMPGRLSEAIAHDEQALRSRPNALPVRMSLAAAYYRSGRLREAVTQLEIVVETDPNYENARRNLAALRQQLAQ